MPGERLAFVALFLLFEGGGISGPDIHTLLVYC